MPVPRDRAHSSLPCRAARARWVVAFSFGLLHGFGFAGRVEELIPIRYGRMMANPFAFFRGGAAIMAYDLSHTPATGVVLQACGDCHLLNFGGFVTAERKNIRGR